ncbi:MAG TPA: hypothetical protein VF092_14715 [Longimicrobium sp.]
MPSLKITFHGLCMFAPQGNDVVHVLMPATGGGPHEHHAFMRYDRKQEDPPKLGGRIVPLVKHDLLFDGVTNGLAVLTFGDGVPKITDPAKKLVPKDHVGNTPDKLKLQARVALLAGEVTDIGELACWSIKYMEDGEEKEKRVTMTDYVEWTWDLIGSTVQWSTSDLGSGVPNGWTKLVADGSGVISVDVHHVHFMPDKPPFPGLPAPHFDFFYKLIGSNNAKTPTLVGSGHCDEQLKGFVPALSATLYSCMIAAGELEP